jgi:hypothetical protein
MSLSLNNLTTINSEISIANKGRYSTEKSIYHFNCQFKFDAYKTPNLLGYDLLIKYKFYHPVNNPLGVNRDHMLSIEYGWRNNIDSSIISHPANCEILISTDNFKKGTTSSITLDDLLERIEQWETGISLEKENISIKLPKSKNHREKLSTANKDIRSYTNGITNIKQHKDIPAPNGYRPGMTRKKVTTNKPILKCYTNGTIDIRQNINSPIPIGYYPGKSKGKNFVWHTNGVDNIYLKANSVVPFGYYKGRTMLPK